MIIGKDLPNIPWQDKPAGCKEVIWRYSANPVIKRNQIPGSNSIFNSAIVEKDGKFVGVFRSDDTAMQQHLFLGKSDDAINWQLEENPIQLLNKDGSVRGPACGYDPRVCMIDGRYYVTWCNSYYGPTIGIAYSDDFKNFYQLENAFLPCNRNGVLFPKKIDGKFIMLSRPSDRGHTPFGDIFISQSKDMEFWGQHRFVMGAEGGWSWTKIGAGPIPIEIDDGWLLIYHGVATTCNGMVYSMGAAILDKNEPWKVLYRAKPYLMRPQELYECVGDVPNVVFPCSTLCDAKTGRIAIYYGAADTVVSLAFTQVDELVEWIKKNS